MAQSSLNVYTKRIQGSKMLSVAAITKSLGRVSRGSNVSRAAEQKVALPTRTRGVRGSSMPVGGKSMAQKSLRQFSTSSALEAAKKKKNVAGTLLRQMFGRTTRDEVKSRRQGEPPTAPQIPFREVRFNQPLRDNYHYMTNLHEDKTAQNYIAEEDSYSRFKLATDYAQYAKMFSREIRSQSTTAVNESVPEAYGEYYYYTRTEPNKDMSVYCRKKGIDGPEEVLFDANVELAKHKQLHVGTMKVNEDQTKILVLLDTSGKEAFEVHVRDTSSPNSDTVRAIKYAANAEWAPDGRSIYYTEPDDRMRPHRVYKHVLGTSSAEDKLIYEENDDQFFLDVARTKDRKFITINSNSKTTSELRIMDAHDPDATPRLIMSRQKGTEFFLDHCTHGFVIVTADGADANYKVAICADEDILDMSKWRTISPSTPNVKLDDIDVFDNHIVIYERKNSLVRIRVIDLRTNEQDFVHLPSEICHIEPGANLDPSTPTLRFVYSTPIIPGIVYDYVLASGDLKKLQEMQVPKAEGARNAFNPDDYHVERIMVPSTGGVNVPMTVVRRKDMKASRDNPTLLQCYGAYGRNYETPFDVTLLPLLSRGWCIATAHVRGGGELGLKWYHAGRMMQKKNTFEDLHNCVQYLFDQNITSSPWLVGKGASAGGLPFAVLANEYPGIFKAVVLRAPFVDVVKTMSNESLPLTVHEYDEWGNPNQKEAFEYIHSYDPYFNLRTQEYPHMYIQSSLMDIRVPCWNHLRYVARLRAVKSDDHEILLRVDAQFGHFGDGSDRGISESIADEYSFIYGALNIVPERI